MQVIILSEISSFAGSVTSEIVPVRVIQPGITAQPIDASGVAGGSAVLVVSVIGTDPISYEWRRGGEKVAGGDNASLTISDLSESSGGSIRLCE